MLLSVAGLGQPSSTSYEREPRARQLAQMVVSVVNLTRTALITAQPDKRACDLLRELSDREGIRIYPAEDNDEDRAAARSRRSCACMPKVRRSWAKTRASRPARRTRPTASGSASASTTDDEYWVMLPRERVERDFPLQWLGWGAAALCWRWPAPG
jgi:two-component system osmolarity sensor histidine kinase EnvZ